MTLRYLILAICCTVGLAGCSGNYRFDDDQYRPLGDPNALQRLARQAGGE